MKKNDILIGYDNNDIYFILDGIIRGAIVNKDGLERIDNGDRSWIIVYDLYNTQEDPKHITDSWTGDMEIY